MQLSAGRPGDRILIMSELHLTPSNSLPEPLDLPITSTNSPPSISSPQTPALIVLLSSSSRAFRFKNVILCAWNLCVSDFGSRRKEYKSKRWDGGLGRGWEKKDELPLLKPHCSLYIGTSHHPFGPILVTGTLLPSSSIRPPHVSVIPFPFPFPFPPKTTKTAWEKWIKTHGYKQSSA